MTRRYTDFFNRAESFKDTLDAKLEGATPTTIDDAVYLVLGAIIKSTTKKVINHEMVEESIARHDLRRSEMLKLAEQLDFTHGELLAASAYLCAGDEGLSSFNQFIANNNGFIRINNPLSFNN